MKFLDSLQEAGLDAIMHVVADAPQHVSLSHPEMSVLPLVVGLMVTDPELNSVNKLLSDFVLETTTMGVPPAPDSQVTSPWLQALYRLGLPEDDSDSSAE